MSRLLAGGELLCHVSQIGCRFFTEIASVFLQERSERLPPLDPEKGICSRLDVAFCPLEVACMVERDIVSREPFLDGLWELAPLILIGELFPCKWLLVAHRHTFLDRDPIG